MIREVDYFSKIYKVGDGDTVASIALKFNIDEKILYEFNENIEELEKGDLLFIPQKNLAIHIVLPGETLKVIAQKYNVTEEYIKEKNNITSLFVGLKLYI